MKKILFDENVHTYVDTYLDGPTDFKTSGYDKSFKTTKYYSYDKFTVGKIYRTTGKNFYYQCTFEILEILNVNNTNKTYYKYIILFTTNKDKNRQPGCRRMFSTNSDFYNDSYLLEDQCVS